VKKSRNGQEKTKMIRSIILMRLFHNGLKNFRMGSFLLLTTNIGFEGFLMRIVFKTFEACLQMDNHSKSCTKK
jgi:hypothetical protein